MISARSRALDWTCAAAIFVWGATLLLPGETLASSPAYVGFLERAPETTWGVLMVAIGAIRFASLIINGWWRRSPLLRAFAAILGAVMWGQISLMFLAASVTMHVVSVGVGLHLVLLASDLFSAFRAGSDAAHQDRRHGHALHPR